MRLDLPIPGGLRYGQALFAFLCWLADSARVKREITCYIAHPDDSDSPVAGRLNFALADPFNIPDDQLERWWAEWLAEKFPSDDDLAGDEN